MFNVFMPNPDNDEQAIKTTKHFQEILVNGGLVSRTVFNESAMKMKFEWTPDGLRFREVILKAYDSIAKTEGENTLREFCGLVAFIIMRER